MQYLEYIHTDGACWFNTNIIPDTNTKIEVDYIEPVADMGSWCCDGFVGAQNYDDAYSTFQIREGGAFDDKKLWIRVGNKQVESQTSATVFTNVSVDKDYFISNGETVSIGTTYYETCNYPLIIGGINNPSWSHKRAANANIGEVKIYSSGVLVGDFIPAVNNGVVGYHDDVNSTFISKSGTGTPTAGPRRSSIVVKPSSKVVGYNGETVSASVQTENYWVASVADGSWLTLDAESGAGNTVVTISIDPNYDTSARTDTITFTDMNTTDEAVLSIKQKKYTDGQPMYLGGDEITEFYLGTYAVTEMYLGTELVFSVSAGGGGDDTPEYCNSESEDYSEDACSCIQNGGEWIEDGENSYCDEGGGEGGCDSPECEECEQNGGTWVIPEIGAPYCHNPCDPESPAYDETICACETAGGTWYDDGMGTAYCDCGGDPQCECESGGGTWDDTNQECTYPE